MHERDETTTRRWTNAAITVLFAAGLAVPFAGTFLRVRTGGLKGENRAMAAFPRIKGEWVSVVESPRKFEAWFDDHFGFRNVMVRAHGQVQDALGVSMSDQVVIGRKGWLFYADEHIIDSHRGIYPFSDEELRRWQRMLEEKRDWLASQGIAFVYMIAPEKSSIYPELIPDYLKPVSSETRMDQFIAWMRAHSTVDVLDLREGLLRAKAEGQGRLFCLTDTHWTDIGAFAAYRQLAEYLRSRYPAVKPLERSDFDCRVLVMEGGDLAGMLGRKSLTHEDRLCFFRLAPDPAHEIEQSALMKSLTWIPDRGPLVMARDQGEIPRAVVYRDSFFTQVVPFLSQHFKRTVFMWWDLDPRIITDEKPDILIEERVERMLSRAPPVNAPPMGGFTAAK